MAIANAGVDMRGAGLATGFLCWVRLASAADPSKNWTEAMNMALQGPVHTQVMTVKRLGPDFRPHPRIFIWSPTPWLVFDPNGHILEQTSEIAVNGKPLNICYSRRDSEGRELEWTQPSGDGTLIWHNEYTEGPFGPIEIRTYLGDTLSSRRRQFYDERGKPIESEEYDASDAVMGRSIIRYDERGREVETIVTGTNDEFLLDEARSFNAAGDVSELTWYDEQGQLVRRFTLQGEEVVDYWQDPAWQKPVGTGLAVSEPDSPWTTAYNLQDDGSLLRTRQHHAPDRGSIETDHAEMYDQDGNVLDEVAFQYQRDSHGNWTRRIISAWDPQSGRMVPIEEDDRTITYY